MGLYLKKTNKSIAKTKSRRHSSATPRVVMHKARVLSYADVQSKRSNAYTFLAL